MLTFIDIRMDLDERSGCGLIHLCTHRKKYMSIDIKFIWWYCKNDNKSDGGITW